MFDYFCSERTKIYLVGHSLDLDLKPKSKLKPFRVLNTI